MHVIRDCEDVLDFWRSIVKPEYISHFLSMGLHGWLDFNLSFQDVGVDTADWQTFFGVAIYELWRDRNKLVFERASSLGQELLLFVNNQAHFIAHGLKLQS